MGFFSDVTSALGGGSKSGSSSQSGFSMLPPELQAAFKDYAPLINQYTNPNDPANVARFTPMAQTAGETSALAKMDQGFTPDQAQLTSDINMQMNPFDDSVISEINRQGQGQNSVLQQQLDQSGQFGSNRGILGANDIDLSRMNLIGKFKQDQYNTALNNSLNTLTDSRRTDATGALTGGTYARNLDTATKQAPITALTTFGQLLGAIPQSGGSTSTSQSSSQGGLLNAGNQFNPLSGLAGA